jgi:hypothetical protein
MEKKYFCNVCKKTITEHMFFFSINKFKRPLCNEHQNRSANPTTNKLQDLVKKRHENELQKEEKLVSIKDWINADFDKWESQINNKEQDSYFLKENNNEKGKKKKYHQFIRNKGKNRLKRDRKIGGGKK